jgi:SAM-dependent methyltransferase
MSLEIQKFYETKSRASPTAEYESKVREYQSGGFISKVLHRVEEISASESLETVVELGAGTGSTLALLNHQLKSPRQSLRLIGVDFHIPGDADRFPGVEYVECDIMHANEKIPPGSVSLLLMVEVIEHLWDPDGALDEVYDLLRPNGYLVLTTPNLASGINRVALFLGFQPVDSEVSIRRHYGRPGRSPPVGHIRLFAFKTLLEIVAAHGFQVVDARTYPHEFKGHKEFGRSLSKVDQLFSKAGRGLGSRILCVLRKPLGDP